MRVCSPLTSRSCRRSRLPSPCYVCATLVVSTLHTTASTYAAYSGERSNAAAIANTELNIIAVSTLARFILKLRDAVHS